MARLDRLWQAGDERPVHEVSDGKTDLSPRDISLLALVELNDVSVRLRNSISCAHTAGKLPFKSVGDYLDSGGDASAIMMRSIRNFGRKTARELHWLVIAHCEADIATRPCPSAGERIAAKRAELMALFETDTLAALAADAILSTRLANVLVDAPFATMRFSEAIESFQQTAMVMLRLPNCGRKSVNEFREFCMQQIRFRLHQAGYDDIEALTALLLSNRPQSDAQNLNNEVATEQPVTIPVDFSASASLGTPEHHQLAERLEWLLAELDPRARLVLQRRNGIGQPERETLEEIGDDLGVTRERIRQIEAKALRRLRVRVRRVPIGQLLFAESPHQWRTMTNDAPLLRSSELHERRRAIDAYVRLALDIEELTIEGWLDQVAYPMPYGWLSPSEDKAAVEAAAMRLEEAIKLVPLPQAFVALVGADEAPAARLAAELILGRPERYGYVMPPRVGVRLTRLVRLHALLASDDDMVPLEQLLRGYRTLFNDDPCSERDAEIVMDAAPHLFLEVEEGCWSAIGEGGMRFEITGGELALIPPRTEDPGTIAHALQATLADRGPTRLSDLLDDGADILPDGRSINSIGPVLLTRRALFVRALPGVYALPEQLPVYTAAIPENWPVLFNDTQARLYALARYAGEPRRIFPLWSAHVEYALCCWARHSGGPGIFESLLAVAAIEDWPIGEADGQEWRRLQAREGRYELGSSLRHEIAYERPSLDRVFAACRYAAVTGSFNWFAANRLTGRRIDSHGGAGLVALLFQLGAVEEIDQDGYRWQHPHRATAAAATFAARLGEKFARNGALIDWNSAIGVELTERAARIEAGRISWVDASAVADMLNRIPTASAADTTNDPLEQLFADQRRAREAERRHTTLQWLLEE